MTKLAFLTAYRAQMVAQYEWAKDGGKLDSFMHSVMSTIYSPKCTWVWDGPSTKAAWQAIGGKGKPTLKGLRALA